MLIYQGKVDNDETQDISLEVEEEEPGRSDDLAKPSTSAAASSGEKTSK